MEKTDFILVMLFNRFNLLWRVWKRCKKYKGQSRPDMTVGCDEKLDFEFIWWVLFVGDRSFFFASWRPDLQGFNLHSAPRLEQATKSSPKDRALASCERRLTNWILLKNISLLNIDNIDKKRYIVSVSLIFLLKDSWLHGSFLLLKNFIKLWNCYGI